MNPLKADKKRKSDWEWCDVKGPEGECCTRIKRHKRAGTPHLFCYAPSGKRPAPCSEYWCMCQATVSVVFKETGIHLLGGP